MLATDTGDRFDTAAVGVGLVDTRTAQVITGNAAYAQVLERAPDSVTGVPVETFLAAPDAAVARTVLTAMRDGMVDSLQGETHVHLPSGPATVYSWSLILGASTPREAVIVGALPVASGGRSDPPPVDIDRVVLATVDRDWRFEDMAVKSSALLGLPEDGRQSVGLHDVVHPGDHQSLGRCIESAASNGDVTTDLRIRGRDGNWLRAGVTLSRLCGPAAATYAVVIDLSASSGVGDPIFDRMSGLEERLWRIALEVEAAGLFPPVTGQPAPVRMSEMNSLSSRQRDILARLAAGDRVPTIAKVMHLSQSTVRNHLSALFRKFGVHSQAQLLDLLRGRAMELSEERRRAT